MSTEKKIRLAGALLLIIMGSLLILSACAVAQNEGTVVSTAANAVANAQQTAVILNVTSAASIDDTAESEYNEYEMNRVESIGRTAVAQGTQVVQIPDDGIRFVPICSGGWIPFSVLAALMGLALWVKFYLIW